MFGFLLNRSVASRLTLGFSVILLMLLGVGATALIGMTSIQSHLDKVVQENNTKTRLLSSMLDGTRQVTILVRNSVLLEDTEYARSQIDQLGALRAQFEADRAALEKLPSDERGRSLREQTYAAREAAKIINDEVLRLAAEQNLAAARHLLVTEGTAAMQAWSEPLNENMQIQNQNNQKDYQEAHESYQKARMFVIVLIVTALLLGVVLAMLITRSLTAPLAEATKAANDIAQGKFDTTLSPQGKDEVAALLTSMKNMQSVLIRFTQAQKEMYDVHQTGDIEFRMNAKAFPGTFSTMVDEVNHLSQSFIDDTLHIIDIIGSYGQGDLSRDINRMPGKKVVAVNAVDTVKSNLLGVNAQIKELVDAALAGDFSLRGNANRFQFVYRELVEQLNQLMAISDKGLTEVGTLLTAIADGDLNKRINTQLPGQFGQLAADANQTASKLSDVVGGIRHAVDSINSAANEIATGNSDLSGRTEAQAASLEETAASMEELTATVRQNTENSREANGLAQDASNVAERGGVTVKQVVETMSKIQQASQRIGDIIGTIDSIAFQTNILALNAAVEAARAGEQGRGFAVVASEVRALAQRSADAAREIKILITDSVEQISEGANQVNTAGSTMQDIVGSIGSVSALMSEIYAASQEQSAGIEQVNLAITQMDEGTQQNAALVEEASAAAESLRQQAAALVQAVSIFH